LRPFSFLSAFLFGKRKAENKNFAAKESRLYQKLSFFKNISYDIPMHKFTTTSKAQTQKLGEALAKELKGGEIICLSGDLGTGKTTFTQGLLKGLDIKGPYTSPTFVIMKHYHETCNMKHETKKMLHATCSVLHDIYHIDAYRIKAEDLLELSWKEITADKNNIVIVEWAERVKKAIPQNAIWIKFKWIDENKRELKILQK
jgi:tRNA threonylcarbamoyladenosine biosynthesis protein TsaE